MDKHIRAGILMKDYSGKEWVMVKLEIEISFHFFRHPGSLTGAEI
jgi:hypothetical protein